MLGTKVNIGKLDRRITIQSPVITDGSANSDIINSWTDVVSVWAWVIEKAGNELVEADRITHVQNIVFRIRYRTNVTLQMRIVFNGFAYRILSIINNASSRNRYLDIATELLDTVEVEDESDRAFTVGFTNGYN